MYRASKSSLIGKITVLVVICFLTLPVHAKYGGGTGEPNDPYLIYTAEQMNAIGADSNDWNKHFKLMADIDLSAYTGTSFNIIGYYKLYGLPDVYPFTGVFDGNNHTISDFTYTSTETNRSIGIFGYLDGPNALIKDLGLINPNVVGTESWGTGSLVGYLREGTITNCYAEDGSVSGDEEVGGLVGNNGGWAGTGTITNCYSTVSVSGNSSAGGLVGWNYGEITKCYTSGSVMASKYVGGLVGEGFRSRITNSYSTASVTGGDCVGGLAGNNSYGKITNCYSAGTVLGDKNVGGLLGSNSYGSDLNCFWDIQTSGQTTSDGGTPKTTEQMQEMSTFLYWGACGNQGIWTIDSGNDYPRLAWQNLPGVLIEAYEPVYGGGSGTEADPYQIWTAEQLRTIGLIPCQWDKHFLLCANVDLGSYSETSFNIIGNYENPFTGVFDGNGHTISNFTYTSTGIGYIGLFGYVSGEHAGIKNLGLIDPNVDRVGESWQVGSLVGWLRDGTITNCYVEGGGVVGYGDVGGLVGRNYYGTISNCYATVSVSGVFDIGGMVGENDGTITDCCSTSSVAGDSTAGGLAGNNGGSITNCCSSGSVSRFEDTWNAVVGGLVGYNIGKVSNSYSTAGVEGDKYVGGLVGDNSFGCTINNCYSIGSVSGSEYVGGLLGHNHGHVIASFWDIETSGQADSSGGKGKTTEQMMMKDTFVHWGTCDQVWTINEGVDYPRLVWENKPGEPIVGIIPLEGDGAADNPYLIYTAEELNVIGLLPCLWDKHFKLMANIDLSRYAGTEFNIIVRFTGTFNGNYHTISNFSYNSITTQPIGLFGYVDDPNAEIKNLGLIDPNLNVWSSHYVGSLVGELYNGTISNCYVKGGSVSGKYSYHIGGLVGCNSYGTIFECYSACGVSGYLRVGGFVGWNYYGTISMCYSSGRVSGPIKHVGGLVGNNFYGEVTDSFWDIETSGQATSSGGTGKTTAEMQMMNTFTDAGWDFVGEIVNGTEDIWWIPQGDYPHLWWERMQVPMKLTPGTLNCRSKGGWVKAHFVLPADLTVEDVDSNILGRIDSLGIEADYMDVFVDEDGLVRVEMAFDRAVLCEGLTGAGSVEITVGGFLINGRYFYGTEAIKIK